MDVIIYVKYESVIRDDRATCSTFEEVDALSDGWFMTKAIFDSGLEISFKKPHSGGIVTVMGRECIFEVCSRKDAVNYLRTL